jgi:SAM-dependent methyltransferase
VDTKRTVRTFFDEIAWQAPYHERYQERTNNNAYDILTRKDAVLSCLARLRPNGGRLLDVGCGPAVFTAELTARDFEVWGVDLSPEVVELARRIANEGPRGDQAHFSVGDIEQLDFGNDTFDTVLAIGIFEYLPSDEAALAQVRRVLKPGGLAILSLQNRYSYWTGIRSLAWPLRPLLRGLLGRRFPGREFSGHHRTRSHAPRSFRRIASRHGMTAILEERVNFNPIPFNVPGSLPRPYLRSLDWVNRRPEVRRMIPWACGTYLVALRKGSA